jgi:hypothetical protein
MLEVRRLLQWYRLRCWEHYASIGRVRKEEWTAQAVRRIPWGGLVLVFFCTIFFGVDLYAGVRHSAEMIKQEKMKMEDSPELQALEKRHWSIEQTKNYREGPGSSSSPLSKLV